MKRLYAILFLLGSFILSAFMLSSSSCPTNDDIQTKSGITCSTCHTLDVNDVIIDEDGKDEEDVDGDGVVDNITIDLDVSQYTGLVQLDIKGSGISIKDKSPLVLGDKYQLFEAIKLTADGKKEETISMTYTYPENFTSPEVITIQGVIADGDGTAEGDFSFFKEMTIYPPKIDFTIAPSIAQTSIYLDELLEGSTISIINIIGKTVHSQPLDASKRVEVSQLEKGTYFLVAGYGKNKQTKQFVVSK